MATFARVTDNHDLLSLTLSPCAALLYRWLLRANKAGRAIEVELEAFSEWTGQTRHRPYSLKHVKRSLDELLSTGIVEVAKRYSGRIFKLIAHHPDGTFSSQNVTEKSQNRTEMSKIQPSNPHSVVPITENLETTGQLAAVENEQDKVDPVLAAELETIGVQLNPQLSQLILQTALTRVKQAIEVLKQRLNSGRVKNPEGFLTEAIRQGWTVKGAIASVTAQKTTNPAVPPEFNEWFELAKQAKLVTASTVQGRELMVLTNLGQWETYAEMAGTFSINYLRKLLTV